MFKEKGICEFEPSWGTMYMEEYRELKRFTKTNDAAMYFDYDAKVVKSAVASIRTYIKKENLPLYAVRRQNRVYIVKENEKNVK